MRVVYFDGINYNGCIGMTYRMVVLTDSPALYPGPGANF